MTEIPPLRAGLQSVAEAYSRKRRARRKLIATACAICALALAATVVHPFAASNPTTDEIARPAPTSTAASQLTLAEVQDELASVYRVFGRRQYERDRVRFPVQLRRQADFDTSRSRLIAQSGRLELYAVPALIGGRVGICALQLRAKRPISATCGDFTVDDAWDHPLWMKAKAGSGAVYSLLLPDGVAQVEITLNGGYSTTVPVQDNGVTFERRGVRKASWLDGNGAWHETRFAV